MLRLSRYRAARIGVDVNLHTGRRSFDQAVRYFMEGGGLDREGANFRLGAFHDQLISYGTLPLAVVEWLMFDDDASLQKALP